MINYLDVPEVFHQNSPIVTAVGYEETGEKLIKLATSSVDRTDLGDADILDIGCGVRFTMSIINKRIPIKSYTGIDVNKSMIEYLKTEVELYDDRFSFAHWNAHNEMYNPNGRKLTKKNVLPVDGAFDVIWLFSVFTHLDPSDSLIILKLLRQRIRAGGKLFFTAFIDNDLDGFEDRVEGSPLLHAYFGKSYMHSLITSAGWKIDLFHEADPSNYIQHYIVCSPN
ncbi:MAG: SAM-dependent methyltransferase [Arenicella sp.]|jgi:SAM-dependent methyltransferase